MQELIFGERQDEGEIPCSKEFLDYLQSEISLLKLYIGVLTKPSSMEQDHSECIRYSTHNVINNIKESEKYGEFYNENSSLVHYKIFGGRHFYFDICPFHLNTTNCYSFFLDAEKNLFFCHGCGIGGSSFEFIQEIYNLSDLEVIKVLSALLYLKKEELDDFYLNELKKLGVPSKLSSYEKSIVLRLSFNNTVLDEERLIKEADRKRENLINRTNQYIQKLDQSGRLDTIIYKKAADRICVDESFFKDLCKQYKKVKNNL